MPGYDHLSLPQTIWNLIFIPSGNQSVIRLPLGDVGYRTFKLKCWSTIVFSRHFPIVPYATKIENKTTIIPSNRRLIQLLIFSFKLCMQLLLKNKNFLQDTQLFRFTCYYFIYMSNEYPVTSSPLMWPVSKISYPLFYILPLPCYMKCCVHPIENSYDKRGGDICQRRWNDTRHKNSLLLGKYIVSRSIWYCPVTIYLQHSLSCPWK